MMPESFTMTCSLSAKPAEVYAAWLSSREHSAFTGAAAKVSAKVGGKFTAWDGYIEGETLELDTPRRIVQSWRTTEFPTASIDSRLELLFSASKTGTKLTLRHTNIPKGQGKMYKQGWKDHYFEPMTAYFRELKK